MDVRPSSSSRETSRDEHRDSGNTSLTCDSVKQIHVETTVDKSTHTHYHAATDPEGTGSKPMQMARSCCDKMNADGIALCDEFRDHLRDFYRELTLPRVAWIDEAEDLSIVDHFIQLELELEESKKPIAFETIFQPVDKTRPTRILIEGQPGFGKTTLATKLAHDWATAKTYIDFKFVYFVPLRELREQSLEDAIAQIGERCDSHENMQMLNWHMKSTLLILDGLDEISRGARPEILKVLYKQKYRALTVLVFRRPDSYGISKEERVKLFGLTNRSVKFQDKQITTLGVTSNANKRTFLAKFVPQSRIDNIVEHLSLLWELFDSPLLLMLLSVIIQQDEKIEEVASRAQFYKQLFNCIFKHSYAKRGRKIAADFDLFCLDSSPNAIQRIVKEFGKLSIQNILELDLQFKSNETTNEIYDLGFLIKHREMTYVSSRNHYEGLHLSIVEFAAAFGLWADLKLNSFASVEKDFKLIVSSYLNGGTSLVLPFFVSFVEGESDVLLSQIKAFSALYSLDFDLTLKLISECESRNFFQNKYLRSYVPHCVVLNDRSTCGGKLLEILTYGSECGQIERIKIDSKTDQQIFATKIAPSCEIEVTLPVLPIGSTFKVLGSAHHVGTIPHDGSLNELLHFAASSNCEMRYSTISPHISHNFLVAMNNERALSQIAFRYLEIKVHEELDKIAITQLLENDQVQNLYLTSISSQFDMSGFCRAAAKSTKLKCLYLTNFTIDLYDLSAGGTKKYTLLSLSHCNLICMQPLLLKNCCHHLKIENVQNVETLVNLEPCVFTHEYNDGRKIQDWTAKCPKWSDTMTTMTINYFDYDTNLNSAFVWKNLRTLIIERLCETDQKGLASCVHTLSIINLVIMYSSVQKLDLFEHMNNLCCTKKNSRLKRIVLRYFDDDSTLKDLIEGLECNHWDRVLLFRIYFPDYEEFVLASTLRITPVNCELICAQLGLTLKDYYDDWSEENMISISR